jgi:hypothetical protein
MPPAGWRVWAVLLPFSSMLPSFLDSPQRREEREERKERQKWTLRDLCAFAVKK